MFNSGVILWDSAQMNDWVREAVVALTLNFCSYMSQEDGGRKKLQSKMLASRLMITESKTKASILNGIQWMTKSNNAHDYENESC